MGKAQSKSMNVTTADQAKAGVVEEGAGKVGKIEETAAPVNGDANHETVRDLLIYYHRLQYSGNLHVDTFEGFLL